MDNQIYISFANPVKFFKVDRENLPKYFTRHFDSWEFEERILDWQQPEESCRIWQTTDIISLQFQSTFDPIIIELLDENGDSILTLPALIGLPNDYNPGFFAFEVHMSLANLETGCYRLKMTLGLGGEQEVLLSNCQYISAEQIRNSIILEYWNSRYHQDILFESGIQMQARFMGHFGFLEPGRKDEFNRDQQYNPNLLNSRTLRQWPVYFGNEYGLTDDEIDLINRIWSMDNVLIDGKPFGVADGAKFDFLELDSSYPKRGLKVMVEEGINRNSSIFAVNTDTTKKLITTIIVEAKVFGDLSNQGSSNTVPVVNIE